MRSLLFWLALVIVLLALGALATYILLYRPTDQMLRQANVRATESAVDLSRAKFDLDKAQADLQTAQSQQEDAQNRLGTELTRVQVLRMMSSLKTAQIAIQARDAAGASKALAAAQDMVNQVKPRLDKIDPNEFSTLQALFTLVNNGLAKDMTLASQDLDRLITELARLDNALE